MRELLAMPEIARELGITLRRMAPHDIEFLRDLYISTRWEEMQQAIGWTDAQRRTFLASQADLQHLSYTAHHAESEFGILQRDGAPLGRLYLRHIGCDELRVVDIALTPEWRRKGLGGALLRAVMKRASTESRFVSMHMERNNPARRLYERLGFRVTEQKEVHDFLVWRPEF